MCKLLAFHLPVEVAIVIYVGLIQRSLAVRQEASLYCTGF